MSLEKGGSDQPPEQTKYFTLEEILHDHPPKEEVFKLDKGRKVSAKVSRNEGGVMIYVVPESAKYI